MLLERISDEERILVQKPFLKTESLTVSMVTPGTENWEGTVEERSLKCKNQIMAVYWKRKRNLNKGLLKS